MQEGTGLAKRLGEIHPSCSHLPEWKTMGGRRPSGVYLRSNYWEIRLWFLTVSNNLYKRGFYRLQKLPHGRLEIIPCTMDEWVEDRESPCWQIQSEINGATVSTVFLGLDHGHFKGYTGDASPLIFETMIFRGPREGYQERHSTVKEAQEGHQKAVDLISIPKSLVALLKRETL